MLPGWWRKRVSAVDKAVLQDALAMFLMDEAASMSLRRIATRFDRNLQTFLSAVALAATVTWWLN
jgi:hypothetical protein